MPSLVKNQYVNFPYHSQLVILPEQPDPVYNGKILSQLPHHILVQPNISTIFKFHVETFVNNTSEMDKLPLVKYYFLDIITNAYPVVIPNLHHHSWSQCPDRIYTSTSVLYLQNGKSCSIQLIGRHLS